MCALFLFACNQENKNLRGEYKMVNAPQNVEITLNFDGTSFSGKSAVNRYFGSFNQDKNKIKFSVAGLTMMMGPQNLMEVEQDYIKNLDKVDTISVKKNNIILSGKNGLVFEFEKY